MTNLNKSLARAHLGLNAASPSLPHTLHLPCPLARCLYLAPSHAASFSLHRTLPVPRLLARCLTLAPSHAASPSLPRKLPLPLAAESCTLARTLPLPRSLARCLSLAPSYAASPSLPRTLPLSLALSHAASPSLPYTLPLPRSLARCLSDSTMTALHLSYRPTIFQFIRSCITHLDEMAWQVPPDVVPKGVGGPSRSRMQRHSKCASTAGLIPLALTPLFTFLYQLLHTKGQPRGQLTLIGDPSTGLRFRWKVPHGTLRR